MKRVNDEQDDGTLLSAGLKEYSYDKVNKAVAPVGGGMSISTTKRTESMNFEEMESAVWRKHQVLRFFQDSGNWWTSSRRTTASKWLLVVTTGVLIACIGASSSFRLGLGF